MTNNSRPQTTVIYAISSINTACNMMITCVVLLLVACLTVQESEGWGRWIRIRGTFPGPFGIRGRSATGRDVARDLDTDQDGYLDETELENHLSERDILDFIAALDENGDNLLSIDEFNKQ
ncbi:uncharacterized protein LOC121370735 [Gigantopelta aegis]|uniref:uncharacterized protein LOC121370735 n=1 Tax=Gigantopelta aegis TaxID=1735272 RepID=UPI001B88A22C|nr:uncharacterized protein LOC121370735 [Gigantopelta aegis]XP_041352101.1 uncharacterized protein LOC121370735 [Gigantopelta aegis]